jgi:hypothetical protein
MRSPNWLYFILFHFLNQVSSQARALQGLAFLLPQQCLSFLQLEETMFGLRERDKLGVKDWEKKGSYPTPSNPAEEVG